MRVRHGGLRRNAHPRVGLQPRQRTQDQGGPQHHCNLGFLELQAANAHRALQRRVGKRQARRAKGNAKALLGRNEEPDGRNQGDMGRLL